MERQAGVEHIVQELCESRGGSPGLSVLTSLLASVDVKNFEPCFGIAGSQLVPNMSADILSITSSSSDGMKVPSAENAELSMVVYRF